jgi:hypothetical protein
MFRGRFGHSVTDRGESTCLQVQGGGKEICGETIN